MNCRLVLPEQAVQAYFTRILRYISVRSCRTTDDQRLKGLDIFSHLELLANIDADDAYKDPSKMLALLFSARSLAVVTIEKVLNKLAIFLGSESWNHACNRCFCGR